MKKLFVLWTFSLIIPRLWACNEYFARGYIFEGYIEAAQSLPIEVQLLVLADSTIEGSYFYYGPENGSLKLAGHLNPDLSFELTERDEAGKVTGAFKGNLWRNYRVANGTWSSGDKKRNFKFHLERPLRESHWDYIHRYRSLKEYKNIHTAISDGWRVQSIDLDHQGLASLPAKTKGLTSLLSANLLGNAFGEFPLELTGLTRLEEISLASNNLKTIGGEIGKLKNLRILIMNFNQLKSIPCEIGQLENLIYLDIGSNQLSTLPDEIANLKQLQELHVERNRISETEKQRLRKRLPHCIIYF